MIKCVAYMEDADTGGGLMVLQVKDAEDVVYDLSLRNLIPKDAA